MRTNYPFFRFMTLKLEFEHSNFKEVVETLDRLQVILLRSTFMPSA